MQCEISKCLDETSSGFIKISQKELTIPNAMNEKLARACKMGFFYLGIPEECKGLVDRACELGNVFYKKEEYRSLHLEGFSGFHDRKGVQVESLYLEKAYWSEKMSPELQELAAKMEGIAVDLLKKTLVLCNIPEGKWEQLTGGVTEKRGQVHFTFNHYRPEKKVEEGIRAHRDFGQITVLYINKKGLQAKIENQWKEVMPIDGHFIINFGRALETLVNNPNQLIAAWHRVPALQEDRISFGVFADNHNQSTIYARRNGETFEDTGCTYKEYIEKSFDKYYPEGDK